ncbi:hypothetical protein Q7P37_009573 [Cladosporium fusiforme]
MKSIFTAAIAAASLATGAFGKVKKRGAGKLEPITVDGNAFMAGDDRFYVRGVAYQPGGAADAEDPMLDMDNFKKDVELFKELGINTIRIYTVDNSKDHEEAMKLLDDAGIYLVLDASTPKYSLNRESAETLHQSYNSDYLQHLFATIDEFAGYNNLMLFFSGNEVINAKNNTNAAPYIKAVTRDMKRYIGAQADRRIPVGYSAADVKENIYQQAVYFACGDDDNARGDFFALNDYAWCDPSDFVKSGWDQKVELYSNYSIPLFLSEFGCITNRRDWNEIEALMSENMTSVYSGGLAYEFTTEPNGYGLVEDGSDGVEPNDDFKRLASQFKAHPSPNGTMGMKSDDDVEHLACPSESDDWPLDTENLPEIPADAEDYIKSGAGEGPGLGGEGSHWGQDTSPTSVDLSDGVTESEDTTNERGGSSNNNPSGDSDVPTDGSAASSESAAVSLNAAFGTVAMAAVAVMALLN